MGGWERRGGKDEKKSLSLEVEKRGEQKKYEIFIFSRGAAGRNYAHLSRFH